MKKMNKKGFTIVELTIVIAVIAILAAVLIPTFSGVINKAKLSNAQQIAASVYKEVYALDMADGKADGLDNGELIESNKMYNFATSTSGGYFKYVINNDVPTFYYSDGTYFFKFDGTKWTSLTKTGEAATGIWSEMSALTRPASYPTAPSTNP